MGIKIIMSFITIIVISVLISLYYVRFRKYSFLGGIWGAIFIGMAGGILLNYTFEPIVEFFKNNLNINVLSAFVGSYFFIKIYYKITPK